ncbi:MAG: S41 family peptidase [Planctomycetes bacterium]|nr:S41 family peptidase [Planctomycetota bacterium]MCH9726774.1 S41 family peptidase [Planctomycetota bacterium]MCH9776799.1 S41 family peptidase [Planctomycetota bacterium]MCH9792893.1 S41 family peptidase [Planctomycetota bacterium]MDF1742394.1 S41 family peptidase [Gimesia sp.]
MQKFRLISSFLFLSVVLSIAFSQSLHADEKPKEKDDDYYQMMKLFADTYEQIERNYVKDVDRRILLEAAIRGMVKELDQYSNYISPKDLSRFNQVVEQEFGGIGIQVHIDEHNGRLTVMTPLPGTPAYKAGIRAGDIIDSIEGKSTKGFTLPEAIKTLKGRAGEKVSMSVIHKGTNEPVPLTITREIIHVATVLGDTYKKDDAWDFMINKKDKIGYIRLTHFSRHSSEELRAAIDELKKQGMKGLILDLRFNPGGLLSQATEISDMFIESGKIVSTAGRNSRNRKWEATKEGTYSGFPMAIIVNRYSASASEIVSACLQDHKRAAIVGERTWGKGSVQNVIELEEGESALKLTTASYHRPSGKNIHRFPGSKDTDVWGVTPDENYRLRLKDEELEELGVYRRQRDILDHNAKQDEQFKDKQLDLAMKYVETALKDKAKPEKKSDAKKPEKKPAPKAAKPAKKAAGLPQPAKAKIIIQTT